MLKSQSVTKYVIVTQKEERLHIQHSEVNCVPAKLNGVGKFVPEQNDVQRFGVIFGFTTVASRRVRLAGTASL
jgi:hypothetical protein